MPTDAPQTANRNRLFATTKVPVLCVLLAYQNQPLSVQEIGEQLERHAVDYPRQRLWPTIRDLVDAGLAEWIDDGVTLDDATKDLLEMARTGKVSNKIAPRRLRLTVDGRLLARYFPVMATGKLRNHLVHGVCIWGSSFAPVKMIPHPQRRWIQDSFNDLLRRRVLVTKEEPTRELCEV